MGAYVVYFFVLILLALFAGIGRREARGALVGMCLATWLLIGLRDLSVGTDTPSYVSEFMRVRNWSFHTLLEQLHTLKCEPLYYLYSWLLGQISSSYTFYLLGWAAFPAVALYRVMNDNLDEGTEYLDALLVVMMLGLYAFFVAGIRQTAAISMVLISYRYLKRAKLWRFLVCIGIGYLLHNSVVLFAIAYPLHYLKIKWWYLPILIELYVLCSTINISAVVEYSALLFADRFGAYGTSYTSTQNNSAFIVQLALFIIGFVKLKPLQKRSTDNNLLLALMFVGLLFQSMAGLLAEMSRVSFYFCIFGILLVPRALQEYSPIVRNIVNIAFIVACITLLFMSNTNLPIYKSSIAL